MRIVDAQREVRTVYLGGFPGSIVSGTLWLASSLAAARSGPGLARLILILGGMLIFPATMALLRLMGRRATLSQENPLGQLATQIAFTIPAAIPLILGATRANPDWFYPGFLIVVGAHYLPFVFLYGMPHYWALAAVLIGAGFALGMLGGGFAAGGWLGTAAFFVFAVVAWRSTAREAAAVA